MQRGAAGPSARAAGACARAGAAGGALSSAARPGEGSAAIHARAASAPAARYR